MLDSSVDLTAAMAKRTRQKVSMDIFSKCTDQNRLLRHGLTASTSNVVVKLWMSL